jgi:hypothetical protein
MVDSKQGCNPYETRLSARNYSSCIGYRISACLGELYGRDICDRSFCRGLTVCDYWKGAGPKQLRLRQVLLIPNGAEKATVLLTSVAAPIALGSNRVTWRHSTLQSHGR